VTSPRRLSDQEQRSRSLDHFYRFAQTEFRSLRRRAARPQLDTVPQTDANKVLTGYFPTRPLQMAFDLLFDSINGQWRVLEISITTPQATAAALLPQGNQGKKP
jgi:hypothetical protein